MMTAVYYAASSEYDHYFYTTLMWSLMNTWAVIKSTLARCSEYKFIIVSV